MSIVHTTVVLLLTSSKTEFEQSSPLRHQCCTEDSFSKYIVTSLSFLNLGRTVLLKVHMDAKVFCVPERCGSITLYDLNMQLLTESRLSVVLD